MKTNRRGFFGALAGLAGGVVAAFMPGKKKVWGEDQKDWQIGGGAKPHEVEFEDFVEYQERITNPVDVTMMTVTAGECNGPEVDWVWFDSNRRVWLINGEVLQ